MKKLKMKRKNLEKRNNLNKRKLRKEIREIQKEENTFKILK